MWAPVYGNHGARLHPHDAPDASYRRTRDLLLRAEAAGFDSTLLAQHVIHPSNTEDDVLETWSTIAALAEATSRIELIGAVKPLLFNPLVFAKIAANIADIADGRLSVNLVTGWFLPELEGLGLDPLDHDDRYAYSREWLAAVTELWAGKHVAIGDHGGHPALIRPAPADPPPLYVGGESEPGRALAAEYADVFFINGRPLAETVDVIEDLRARPRHGAPLRFGLSAFVIARETEAEASAELDYLQSLSRRGEPTRDRRGHRPEDPDVQGALRAPNASAPTAAHLPVWSAATNRSSSASTCSMRPVSSCSCCSSSPSNPSWTGSRTRSFPTSDNQEPL